MKGSVALLFCVAALSTWAVAAGETRTPPGTARSCNLSDVWQSDSRLLICCPVPLLPPPLYLMQTALLPAHTICGQSDFPTFDLFCRVGTWIGVELLVQVVGQSEAEL